MSRNPIGTHSLRGSSLGLRFAVRESKIIVIRYGISVLDVIFVLISAAVDEIGDRTRLDRFRGSRSIAPGRIVLVLGTARVGVER